MPDIYAILAMIWALLWAWANDGNNLLKLFIASALATCVAITLVHL